MQYINIPSHRKSIRSTNSLERLNAEIHRRNRVVRIFPNTQSASKLIRAVRISYTKDNEKWWEKLFHSNKL